MSPFQDEWQSSTNLKHTLIPETPVLSEKCCFCAKNGSLFLLSVAAPEETLRCMCVPAATAMAILKIKC